MRSLFDLFLMFFKIGLFTFGGGYAMLPLLQQEVVTKRKFLTDEELLDLYSVGQCTPGIIAVNVATFIGYRQRGIKGAIGATAGIILPSLLIIMMIAAILSEFMHNRYVIYAFAGIRIGVTALIADIIWSLWRKNISGIGELLMFGGAVVLAVGMHLSPVVIVIAAALTALILFQIKQMRRRR